MLVFAGNFAGGVNQQKFVITILKKWYFVDLILLVFTRKMLHYGSIVWKTEKFTLNEKIIREINSLVNTLLSRNFCQILSISIKCEVFIP